MGYTFDFKDAALARAAVLNLNEACKRMKTVWERKVEQWTAADTSLPTDLLPLFNCLVELLKDDSGAEVFYFVTPPDSSEIMARRLCAALRLVAEAIYEEKGLEIFTYSADELRFMTRWAAHCSKAGERALREKPCHHSSYRPPPCYRCRHDKIDVEWIRAIVHLVDSLCNEVAGRL